MFREEQCSLCDVVLQHFHDAKNYNSMFDCLKIMYKISWPLSPDTMYI